MNIPQNLLYTKDHEWVRIDGDVVVVGITDFAQGELGDVVFVQLPEVGAKIPQGQTLGTIEAVKAVADIYSPLSGEIMAVNADLNDKPELMNKDCYGAGWVAKIKASNLAAEKSSLLDPAAYTNLTSA
ncbi:glycine cleavage system protein GcvH [candidate division KSB1 bacterium]|nr:MAG: glycine cleavage system protein GcvH [candidate division KSB1 bacterium]